ncbi:uncharacterized protein N7459_006158 [Penicillium hispanicum]|uniref:uncharacterized protein n=1 Tax=Penicillium hispanicum TaxID=1080232 RepID=UPI00253FEFF6|nr:uncharacterized protein N7459_006158 [Penicillium hispanicum]KAJ5580173.1 hypothetical protein N7459_006158 [Penicillium hispanicum]
MDSFYAEKAAGCISPAGEVDGKLRNPQRRRVPVACKRCRKRKIKCSGDSGDGQGCSNCRSAGNADCQFLRVHSQPLNEAWPYPTMGAALAPSSRRGPYTPHTPVKSTGLSMGSPQAHMAVFQRNSEFDLGAAEAHLFPRSGVGMDAIHYEDEQQANYSQPSAYILPNAPSGVMMDYGTSTWSPKTWDSVFNANRAPNGMYPDPETHTSINQSPFTYMLPSQGLSSSDLPQSTNAVVSVVSSPDASGSSRTLPNPTCRSQQVPSTPAGLSFLSAEGVSGLSLVSDFKSTFWSPRSGTSLDPRSTATAHTVPSNAAPFTSSSPPPKCASSNSAAPELIFTYMPVSSSADENTSLSPSTVLAPSTTSPGNPTYPGLDSLDASSDYKTLPSDTRLTRSYRDHSSTTGQRLLDLTNECAPDIYGYASSEKSKGRATADGGDSRCSAATLMNGLPYTPVRHSEPAASAFSCNLFPDALSEYHRPVENVHRPVEPLSNQSAY